MSSVDASFLQAASEGDLEKVKNLLDKHKLDVNLRGPMNRTALHLASLYGKMEVVIFLVEKKASLDLQDSSGQVPLHLAVLNGHKSVVEQLLSDGANWKVVNSSGKKPGDYARKKDIKNLFEDAEKGILTHEDEPSSDNSNGSVVKKQKTIINQQLVTDLVNLGYPRGDVLDCLYALSESKDSTNLLKTDVMKELEKRKADAKKLQDSSKKETKVDEDNFCKICFENEIDTVIVPCGHVVVCNSCSSKALQLCPMCRGKVQQIVKMFKS